MSEYQFGSLKQSGIECHRCYTRVKTISISHLLFNRVANIAILLLLSQYCKSWTRSIGADKMTCLTPNTLN